VAITVQELKERQAEGYALTKEAEARIREADAATAEEARAHAAAKRIVQNLETEPKLRAAAEEALADVRSLVAAIGPAIERSIEARDLHEATARQLRHDGENCAQIPSLKVAGIKDRALYHDLDRLRMYASRDF
jgi:hypothetical protein